jgi:hypothetical protein
MKPIKIYTIATHSINTLNGVLNESNLEFAKRTFLFNAVRPYTEIVSSRQEYPFNDISDVSMVIDIVILDRKRYDQLIELESRIKNEEGKWQHTQKTEGGK